LVGLDVAVRDRTDPDIGPRRRNGQRADARQRRPIMNDGTIHTRVREAPTRALASDAGPVVVHMPKIRSLGRILWRRERTNATAAIHSPAGFPHACYTIFRIEEVTTL